jgi:phosphate transport system substrate-binding protein
MHRLWKTTITLVALATPAVATAAEMTGAGSTFASPVVEKWSAAYKQATGNALQYQAVGSSIGVNLIKKAAVDFGPTDKPVEPAELKRLGLLQFPLVMGGVVPVVNVAGVKPGVMKFTGPLLADIFLGKIRNWDDAAIRAVNPELPMPHMAITVVHRLDGSGTTFNWSNYLSKVSADWKRAVGEGNAVDWPLGLGGKGNDGVASLVALVPGSIGYLEYSYALQKLDRISFGTVQNSAGNFVSPSAQSFQAAAASADWKTSEDFFTLLTNAPGADAYPIAATTFVVLYKQPKSPQAAAAALDFLRWALENGRAQAEALNYVPLPSSLVQQIEAYWDDNLVQVAGAAIATRK